MKFYGYFYRRQIYSPVMEILWPINHDASPQIQFLLSMLTEQSLRTKEKIPSFRVKIASRERERDANIDKAAEGNDHSR